MSPETLLSLLFFVLMGGLLHTIPGLTRPGLFFAVTVAPEFRRTERARQILLKYRAIVWGVTILAAGLQLTTGLILAAILLQLMGFLGALADGHRVARA